MKKLIFKYYLKDPLSTIAVNTTVLLFGIICFVLFVFTMVIIEESQENNPVRQQHLQQHADEQVKYDKMISILDSINKKLD
tara:strand:- start:387 stop:629 length:243 start_codon:yes stop_codon:yes gene_type:complete